MSKWPDSRLSRRRVLQAAGLSALLAGCGTEPAARSTREIVFWHLMTGGDGERMNAIVSKADAAMPDAEIKQVVLAWGAPYYTKLAMSAAGGRAPDLGIVHMSRLAGYAPGGLLDPWDVDRLARYGVDQSTFTAPAWKSSIINGKLYALALDAHTFVAFFNTELADKAGLLGSDGKLPEIKSLDDLKGMGREFKKLTGSDYGLSYGFLGDGAQLWRLFWTFYTQHGATFDLTGDTFVYDADAFGESVETMRSLVDGEVASNSADYATASSWFLSGNTGLALSGVWELPQYQDAKMPLGALPIPNMFGTDVDSTWGDSHTFVLPHQDDPDEQRRELAYEAVATILKNSLSWGEAGHTPAYQPVVDTPEFKALRPNNDYAVTATYLHYDPPSSFTGSASSFMDQFRNSIQNALTGQISVKDAIATFAERVNVLMSKAVQR
ncbi:extracellular solute-binding protein [Nonomuraea sp. KC401]|uniref:extracellular solute-binding protein n=1 Tax=unclassified Nonomuraea TaxID=2593643 RepID=UPI0010FE6DAD|nr:MULTISPECIES: extracellular solute-binding protein [unclassified Nonomuraea]NBE93381.1 extracellular solute-binding protein [Nonomuraea sp. K271]TLF62672.1 extracellular solute-binding protein [Nonomuraea sp. KC401]